MDIKQTLIDLFETHPTVDTFFMTSDGQFFSVQSNADANAQRLKDRGVATVTREKVQPLIDAAAEAAADPSLAHPEQDTVLTAEELQQKKADDASATEALNKVLTPVAEAEPAAAEPVAEPVAEPAAEPVAEQVAEPAAEPVAEATADTGVDAEIAADEQAVEEAETKLSAAKAKKTEVATDKQ